MKKIILITSLLFPALTFINGQNVMMEISGHKENQKEAYLGGNNSIKVLVEGKWCNEIILKTDNGTIKKESEGCVNLFKPKKYGYSKIDVYVVEEKDTIQVESFSIRAVPMPLAFTFGSKLVQCKYECYETSSKSEFLNHGFSLFTLNMDVSSYVPIVEFEILVYREDKEIFRERVTNYGRKEHQLLKSKLDFITSGDLIELQQIVPKFYDGLGFVTDSIEVLIE